MDLGEGERSSPSSRMNLSNNSLSISEDPFGSASGRICSRAASKRVRSAAEPIDLTDSADINDPADLVELTDLADLGDCVSSSFVGVVASFSNLVADGSARPVGLSKMPFPVNCYFNSNWCVE